MFSPIKVHINIYAEAFPMRSGKEVMFQTTECSVFYLILIDLCRKAYIVFESRLDSALWEIRNIIEDVLTTLRE